METDETSQIKNEGTGQSDENKYDNEVLEVVFASSDFNSPGKGQLSFEKGQQINVLEKSTDDWWWAEYDGNYGYVPANHLASEQHVTWQDEEYFTNYGNLKLHHEMLSDKPRTLAYMKAIVNNAEYLKGKVVLDIGCGTGILSMMCAKHAYPEKVYAVEASDMAIHTKEVIKCNGLSEKIEVLHGCGEESDIKGEVDLIISEWMGTILLFEMMIESVIIMRNKFLKHDGTIWPSSASLLLMPVSAHAQYSSKMEFWDTQFGFDLSYFKSVARDDLLSKPDHDYVLDKQDCLSDEQSVLYLDMKTVTVSELEERISQFSFVINKDNIMHGFCTWFEVKFIPLSRDEEEVTLNTGPEYDLTHWKQNLFLLDDPISVSKGDVLEGSIKITRNPEWRRHLQVFLQFKVFSGYQSDILIAEAEKMYYVWR